MNSSTKPLVTVCVVFVVFLLLPTFFLIPIANYCQSSLPIQESGKQKYSERPNTNSNQSDQQEKYTDDSSPIIKFLKAIYGAQKAHWEKESANSPKQTWWHAFLCDLKITDFLLATFTYWLAIVTAALIYVGVRQEKLLTQSVAAANRSAATGEAALVAGGRAFVFVKMIEWGWFVHPITGAYSYKFKPIWGNSGNTPTKQLKTFVDWPLRTDKLPRSFDFSQVKGAIGTALIAPRETIHGANGPYPDGISAADIQAVKDGTKFLYILGCAKYFDDFPDTPEHATRFCYEISVSGFPHNPDSDKGGGIGFAFNLIPWGNCADDECTYEDQTKNT